MSELKNLYNNENEIDFVELFRQIYLEKKIILKSLAASAFIGIIFSLFQPNQYTSSTTFIPQLSTSDIKSGTSSLSGLASLAGITLGGVEGSSDFPPTLYPQVVESVPFRLKLLSSSVNINKETIVLSDYILNYGSSFDLIALIKKYTIGLPSLISEMLNANRNDVVDFSEIYKIS